MLGANLEPRAPKTLANVRIIVRHRIGGRLARNRLIIPSSQTNGETRSDNHSLEDLGQTVVARSSADFGKRIAIDAEKWAKVIRTANIKLE